MPRPTKLTPAVSALILRNVLSGCTGEVAAAAAGVSARTYYYWRSRGERQQRGVYQQFLQSIKRAEAEIEVACAEAVRSQMPTSWQAAAWMLERRHPERWGRRDRLDVTTQQLAERYAAVLDLDGVSAAELIRQAEQIAREHRAE